MKKTKGVRIILCVLLFWFTLAVTGFSIGNTIFAERDFDLITCVWWGIYLVVVIVFFLKEKIGKYIMLIVLSLWLAMQSLNFFNTSPESIAGYNRLFKSTHHLIPPSAEYVIPDTYHLVLLFLILLSLISIVIQVINSMRHKLQN